MFNKQNFCHVASNNRNEKKAGIFVYKTTDNLATVSTSGYFNEKIIDLNLHDLIIHEQTNNADRTKVTYNYLAVTERTLDNVGTTVIKRDLDITLEQAIADLRTYIDNNFVKIDGTSVMTGPLLMRATADFKCAIAPYWDGVGFFKLNDNNSVTLMASLEYNDGFTPAENNVYNIGSTSKKWKNLYLSGKAFVATINNGYDIAVPVTNSADTLALKSEVDLAANSGRMLTDQGVWFAKMYSASTVPTGAEYDGKNYADFSQVDSDNNPVIKIYTGASGAWTLSETITPPADYDGYVPITSKIWDIVEQTGQQGGRVLWNHQSKDFTPYPQIISFENAALTGTPTAPTPTVSSPNSQVANKEYVDTKTSQQGYHPDLFDWKWADHELDDMQWLNADTFSWQDGGVYEAAYNHLADDVNAGINRVEWRTTGTVNICYTRNINPQVGDSVYSDTSLTTQIGVVEATGNGITVSNNKVYHYYAAHMSGTLPSETIAGVQIEYFLASDGHKICLATQESNVASIYAATGVAWYYIIDPTNQRFKLPRSKHEHYGNRPVIGDGKVLGLTNGSNTAGLYASDAFDIWAGDASITRNAYGQNVGYTTGTSQPIAGGVGVTTDETKSGIISTSVEDTDQYKYLYFYVGEFTQTAIENTAGLNAELFNDKVDLDGSWGFPDKHYDTLTLSASGTSFVAPANGWFCVSAKSNNIASWFYMRIEDTGLAQTSHVGNSGANHECFIPVAKGETCYVAYDMVASISYFRFIYAKTTN